jgi:replicative DNA helicase Mcm
LVEPRLTEEAVDHLKNFYLDMRKTSQELGAASPITITIRQLESLVRLAEAKARVHLREEVTAEDAGSAIALMQSSLEQVGVDVTTGKIDIDTIMTGKSRSLQDKLWRVLNVVSEMGVSDAVKNEELFQILTEDHGLTRTEAGKLIGILMKDGVIYSPRPSYYRRT